MAKQRPPIAEKVRFWKEQDEINQVIIPRVLEMHETLTEVSNQCVRSKSNINNLNKELDKVIAELERLNKQVSELKSPSRDSAYRIDYISLGLAIFAVILSAFSIII